MKSNQSSKLYLRMFDMPNAVGKSALILDELLIKLVDLIHKTNVKIGSMNLENQIFY